jgi:hypothetical protein
MLNRRLLGALAELPGIDASRGIEVLQCSSATATGAIIFHVSTRTARRVDAVVKTPRDPAADHAISAEWDIVTQLHRDANFGSLLPAPLRRFDLDGATFYAYAGIAGNTMFARFRNRLLSSRDRVRASFGRQALDAALRLHASHTRAVSGAALAQDLRDNLQNLRHLVEDVHGSVESGAMLAADLLANSGVELPAGRIHGDFSPYNLITVSGGSAGCSGIIDWEHSEPDRPQYLDIFRFISGSELMGRRIFEGGPALLRMSDHANPVARTLWRPWVQQMAPLHAGVANEPAVYRALWMHFFVAAAYREQRRHANPADVSQSTYFRGLRELMAMNAPATRSP